MCTISIISITLIIYCPENFIIIFIKKVFRVTVYRFWYSIIGRSSKYPVNRVLVAIPSINIYNLTPVESNSDESKFRLSRIQVLVPRCRKPYYLHSLSRIYLSKYMYYLGIKIRSQVKHPVIDFDIFSSPCQRQRVLLPSLGVRRPLNFHILIFSSETK